MSFSIMTSCLTCLSLLLHIITVVSAVPTRTERETDPGQEIRNVMSEVWGGQCFSDDDCFHVISRCDQDRGFTAADGECRLAWWVWLVAALLVLLLLLSLLSCCCLPCCCLYSLCSGVIDFLCSCLCCCCSTRRGYTVARTG